MIEPLRWRLLAGQHPPFCRQTGERLSLTVHHDETVVMTAGARTALDLIREFASLGDVDVADTAEGSTNYVEIGPYDPQRQLRPVTIRGRDQIVRTAVWGSEQWPELARRLAGADTEAAGDVLAQIPILEMHRQGYRHVLATSNATLLSLAQRVPDTNIRTFEQAAKILGLYLRSRGDFTYQVFPSGSNRFDRGLFYWVLCRDRLPAMWKYFSACLQRATALKDGADYLSSSILDRCTRALQARDEVGVQFFAPQDNSTRDTMLYHFDYLTLLLTGAIDAQARIAHRAYEIQKPKTRDAKFQNPAFVKALKAAGADGLVEIADSGEFNNFAQVLWTLRNTIHGTGLRGLGSSRGAQPQASFLRVFDDDAKKVWDAAARLGSREELGIQSLIDVEIEPYTCAVRLTELGLHYVNQFAEATDVGRLLPAGMSVAGLPTTAPEDDIFSADIRRRIDALG